MKTQEMKMDEVKMDEVKTVIFRYIYDYNLRRIYTTNGGYPPEVYRQMWYQEKDSVA
jgi:hypothetical protein